MWDKAQADALVWHTDAYYWDKMKGDFEEQTADDYDVDHGVHFGYGTRSSFSAGLAMPPCRCLLAVVFAPIGTEDSDRAAQELADMRKRGFRPELGSWGRRYDPDAGQASTQEEAFYTQVRCLWPPPFPLWKG